MLDENISQKFMKISEGLTEDLSKNFEEIMGISICGSLSLGNADEYSDIDLDLWLNDEDFKKWSENCPLMGFFDKYSINRETPTNFSFCIGDLYKFDLALLSVKEMGEKEWRVEQKSDRKYSRILFDKNNTVRNLLDSKLKSEEVDFSAKEEYSILNPSPKYFKFYISAYLNYHVPVAIARNKIEQAHFLVNQSVHFLLNLLWIEKEDYYPYDKTKWAVAQKYLDDEHLELLKDALLVKEYSKEDVRRRRRIIRDLYKLLGYDEIVFYHEKLDLS